MPRWTTRTSPSSSRSRRYFPRRCTPVILRPSSLPMKSFFDLWRRIERSPLASTVLIFLPTTSRSRSRRIVSTSGSSGTGRRLLVGEVGGHVVHNAVQHVFDGGLQGTLDVVRHLGLQRLPGLPGRRLLGLLLGPALAAAPHGLPQLHGGVEELGVVGALVGDL